MQPNGFTPRFFRGTDGLTLYARDYDPGTAEALSSPPVICLPGLTRNSRDFHQLALWLSRDAETPRRVVTLDYRGRGQSDRDDNKANYNLLVEAQDVLCACDTFGFETADFIGTSRGGLILHLLAGMRPSLLGRLILNDIGPRIENEGLKHIRDYLGVRNRPGSRQQAAASLRAVHGSAFPILTDADWLDMADALYVDNDGMLEPDFDIAIAKQLQAADLDQPLPDLWTQFDTFPQVPMMVIRGEHTTLLSEKTVAEMQRRRPGLVLLTAPGQGHAPVLHLGTLPAEIGAFLSRA